VIQRISQLEQQYVLEVLNGQFRNSGGGAMTRRLEEEFAQRFNSRFAISFANGTSTMHATLAAAGVGAGHEVIVPPLTMASTAFCVLHAGATPIFADVHPDTWTLDPKSVATRLTPRTKAIIPVALYGLSADLNSIMTLARDHGLFVLEDDAQCFLGYYNGQIVGSIGHASSFSFQSSKHITCGEGGIVTTNSAELATEIRRMSSLGYAAVAGAAGKSKISRDEIQDPRYFRHVSVGWNYRLSDLCSALVLGQIQRIEDLVNVRLQSAHALAQAIHGCRWLIPQAVPDGHIHSYWTYACRLADAVPFSWCDFRRKYLELGGDRFYGAWALNYLEPAVRDKRFAESQSQSYIPGICPVAERLQPRLIQFKTNYFDPERRSKASSALARTIAFFDHHS
jgi:perosamine synthetase